MMKTNINAGDLYDRLGVEPTASAVDIKRAYYRLVRTYPPERAPEEFKRIREAYETLYDPVARQEYDRTGSPEVKVRVEAAVAAMDAKDYPGAELRLKRILLEHPHLHFVRNLLGMCFLYQQQAEKALQQFDRLLGLDSPSPAWFGNAGHAYRMAGLLSPAALAFERAIAAAESAGSDVTSYFLGLAQVHEDAGNAEQAEAVLERAIAHDGQLDFGDLQYLIKLLELKVIHREVDGLSRTARRLVQVAGSEQQATYVAWKLATLAKVLLSAPASRFARPLLDAAVELCPTDTDYMAMRRLCGALEVGNLAVATAILESERAFGVDGWGYDLAQQLRPKLGAAANRAKPAQSEAPNYAGRLVAAAFAVILAMAVCADPGPEPTPGARRPPAEASTASPFAEPTGGSNSAPIRAPVRLPTGSEIIPKGTRGYGEVIVRNGTSRDAAVKLLRAGFNQPVRFVYIRAGDTHKINGIGQGSYLLRFTAGSDWDTVARAFRRSPSYEQFSSPLSFQEFREYDGVRYTSFEITLHGVVGGTARTRNLSAAEF